MFRSLRASPSFIGACFVMIILASPAAAQDATVTSTPTEALTSSVAEPPAYEVSVRASAPVRRSASEVVRTRAVLQAAPHRSTDELLFVVPGVFVTQHGGEGKAFQIFYRGFDAVHGQDIEIWAGGAPVNDVSNIHGQGYADLHFLPVEVVRELRATPGSYDPRQGDFAVAGTLRVDLGYDHPGITAKLDLGSFDARRVFVAYRPDSAPESNFGAVEIYHTGGFGPSRAADRASAVGQWVLPLGEGNDLRLMTSAYSGRFSSAGVLLLSDIESGSVDRFSTYDPTQGGSASRGQIVAELTHRDEEARWSLATYGVLRSMRLRENFTGFLNDPNGDSEQQLNSAVVAGAYGSYRRKLHLFSDKDTIEVGFFGRSDWVEQSQRRLSITDSTVTDESVNASVKGFDIAGYLDLALTPFEILTLRGGARIDGLGYSSEDNGGAAQGQARASQGTHLGAKATIDLRVLPELHALVSYGDGFRSPQARSLAEGQTTPFTTVRSAEAGFQLALPFLAASVAGFRTTLSDDLVFDQSTSRNERVPSTERFGVTADVSARGIEGLTLVASITFTHAAFTDSDARYQAGDLVPYAPQIVARVDGSYTLGLGRVFDLEVEAQVGAALSVLARRPLPFKEMGHDVALVDARAQLSVGPVEVGLELFNLLDTQWFDGEFVFATRWDPNAASSLVPQRVVTVGPPRALLFTLAVHI